MTARQLTALVILLFASLFVRLHAQTGDLTQIADCKAKHPDARCYRLTTTERPDGLGAAITLPVQWWPAREKALSSIPVVWLQGGPGMSNMSPPLPDWVFDHFHVLLIGYRGVDGAPRLDCPTLRKQLKTEVRHSQVPLLGDNALSRLQEQVRHCQQDWEHQGVDTQAYRTLDVIRDIERVREALDLDRISLLSASYGTRIAWYYDQAYPGRVYRNLMLSGNPTGGFFFDPDTIDNQLERLSQWCRLDPQCLSKTPDLKQAIQTVLTNPPNRAWGVRVDPDHLRLVTFMLLYSRQTWPMLADVYGKAEQGNTSGIAAMLKIPNPMTGEDWVWGAFFSAGSIDFDPNRDYRGELQAARHRTTLGSPLSHLIFAGLSQGWDSQPQHPPEGRTSDTPTLILASELDVATPIERVQQHWMQVLTNAALIRVRGAGHAPDHITAGGEPLAEHLSLFLAGGAPDTQETFGQPVDWDPALSLSWLTYGVWALIGALGAGLIYTLIILL